MKVEITRKDILNILLDRASKCSLHGDYMAAIAIEVGRAAIKRVPKLNERDVVRYIDPGTGLYMDVQLSVDDTEAPEGHPEEPPKE